MSEATASVSPTLPRSIGVAGLAASVINITIGSSIFVFPAVVAGALGAAGLLAYLMAAVAMGLIALCFAEAGSTVPRAGGAYAYVETAFGPLVGWLVGSLLYLGVQLLASAVVGTVFLASLAALVPSLAGNVQRATLLIAVYASLALINLRGGARAGTRLVELITTAKVAPLIVLIVVGLVGLTPANLMWTATPPVADVGRMAMRLIYLFAGSECALAVSGELRDPARTVPRGLLVGLCATTFLYVGVQHAAQGLLGSELAAHQRAPLAEAAARVLGSPGRALILAGAVISTIGYLSADMLTSPRTLFALGAARLLPAALAGVHRRFGSPHVAIATHAVLASTLALQADFGTLTTLSSSALLTIYLVCCAAVLVLRRRTAVGDESHFRLPLGPAIPVLAMAVVLALLSTLRVKELVAIPIFLVASTAAYLLSRRARARMATAAP